MFKYLLLNVVLFLTSIFVVSNAYAQVYKTNYEIEYTIKNKTTLSAQINAQVTNLKGDLYLKDFTLGLPKNIKLSKLKVRDDFGPVTYRVKSDSKFNLITIDFNQPQPGLGAINNIYLSFDDTSLITTSPFLWELILPTIEIDQFSTLTVKLKTDIDFDKKITLSKPPPTRVEIATIYWENVKTGPIYLLMGEFQVYNANINYHLKNDSLNGKKYIITLPPDTSYQQLIINSLNPVPDRVFLDSDNNYLAEYMVKPLSVIDIKLNAGFKIFVKPRPELNPIIQQNFLSQKKYLLSPKKFWQINNSVETFIVSFKPTQIKEIFDLVVDKLSYSSKKLNTNRRLGASTAYLNPSSSVCTEYTDLFIGLARYYGFYTREIQGYAYTIDKTIRPVITNTDVLHTWPEYYDPLGQLWRPVDPTWADTANIDYFNSFDANHIALAIHGKDSILPPPAGFFKVKPTKDISIDIAKKIPPLTSQFAMTDNIPKNLSASKKYQSKIIITNTGNYFQYDIKLILESNNIKFKKNEYVIPVLAPYQAHQIDINYQLVNQSFKATSIKYYINGQIQQTKQLTISSLSRSFLIIITTLILTAIIAIAWLVKK